VRKISLRIHVHLSLYNSLIFIILCFITFSSTSLKAQTGNPFIKNYSSIDYNASFSNFDIVQDKRGVLYVGNLGGLLRYDGVKWNFTEIAGGKGVSSLAVDENNRIYIAAIGEFGYLTTNQNGQVVYKSLSKDVSYKEIGRVFNIFPTSNGVFFLSNNYLFKWKNDKLSFWKAEDGKFQTGFELNDKIFLRQSKRGLLTLINDSLKMVPNTEVFLDDDIGTSLTTEDKQSYLFSIGGAVYKFSEGNTVSLFSDGLQESLKKALPISSTYIKLPHSESIYLGTRRNGIISFNPSDKSSSLVVNSSKGLQNDIIFNIAHDNQDGLWVALQDGLSRVDLSKQWTYWDKINGIDGLIAKISRINKHIYVGTTKGVYYLKDDGFVKVKDINSRIFSFLEIENRVYAAGENGVYEIIDDSGFQVSSLFGIWNLFINKNKELLIPSDRSGLFRAKVGKGILNLKEYIPSLSGQAISIVDDSQGRTWMSMKYDGLYMLEEKNDFPVYRKFSQKHGLPDVNEVEILNHNNELLFATGKGFYHLNPAPLPDSTNLFIPHVGIINERLNIKNVAIDKSGNFWLTITSENKEQFIEKIELQTDKTYERISRPFKRLPKQNYIAIYPDPDEKGVVWISGSAGLYRYDEKEYKNYDLPFNTLVRQVALGDSVIFYGNYYNEEQDDSIVPAFVLKQPKSFIPILPFSENNISFEYAAASYEMPEKNMYSYFLDGNDKGWSSWSYSTRKEYSNLPAGNYTFFIKSKNIYDTEGSIASYKFTILPPWYETTMARIGFVILAFFGFWVFGLTYTYRIRIQRQKLKLIVADRTFEVMSQKKEIENKNALLTSQNDEIRIQKENIEEKNKKLEEVQEEILTINQKLQEVNNHLERKVEKRTAEIKDALKKLQQTNAELDTFVYKASHDLKGPISRINGLSLLAKLESPSESTSKYLDLIEKTVKEMDVLLAKLTTVHEILNIEVATEVIDFPILCQELKEIIGSHNDIHYSFDFDENHRLFSDIHLIKIIFETLIENAIIFRRTSKTEGSKINVKTYKKGNFYYLNVWDNGIGIEEENLPKIFNMFYRGSDQSKGNGLGLYILNLAVEKLKGNVSVTSRHKEFTEFTVKIPQKK
jgi:signal transduction histidine kinase/ligand-binding sensor domain-containing protein